MVHHNLRYPAAKRLGIDYDSFVELNPELIYCHTSSYGPKGPRADWPGYDQLFQAASGWEYEGAGEGNPPMWHRFGMMDHQNAMASMVGTLLAIYHRTRTGKGQFCAASLLGASILTISETFIGPDGNLLPYEKLDSLQYGVSPFKRIYECLDKRWICVDAETEAERAALLETVNAKSSDELEQAIARGAQEELLFALERADVPAEPVRLDQMHAFFDSQAYKQANLVARYPHKTWGTLEQIGSLWNMGDLPPHFPCAPPVLGEHSDEICRELGLDQGAVQKLREKKAML